MADLRKLSIVVTAFHRTGYLVECLRGIRKNLPEVEVIVAADDKEESYNAVWRVGEAVRKSGPFIGNTLYHEWYELPYDSGLTAKRNAGAGAVNDVAGDRYTIVASDDYDFSLKYVREGIERMVDTLDGNDNVDLVVGTYENMRYEGHLLYEPNEYIALQLLDRGWENPTLLKPYPAWRVDMGINYFMGRSQLFKDVPWDENIRPIGGEHADWFLDLKLTDKLVVWIEGAKIETIKSDDEIYMHPDYHKLRARAQQGHNLFMQKRNLKEFYGFNQPRPKEVKRVTPNGLR